MKRKALMLGCLVFSLALNSLSQTKDEEGVPVPVGGWSVSFTLPSTTSTTASRQLLFTALSDGTGSFRLIGPRTSTTTTTLFPAVWDRVTTDFISFSSEVELPVGNWGRETGTLIFKGRSSQTGAISGSVVYVVNAVGNTTATVPYVIRTGTFTATPVTIVTTP